MIFSKLSDERLPHMKNHTVDTKLVGCLEDTETYFIIRYSHRQDFTTKK